jgi:hypothetical protein
MDKSNTCDECEVIALEYRAAVLDFWLNANEKTRAACLAIGKLCGGTEADVVRVEELLSPGMTGSPRIADAIGKKFRHQAITGHYINFRH